jgi:hypothetical protein
MTEKSNPIYLTEFAPGMTGLYIREIRQVYILHIRFQNSQWAC